MFQALRIRLLASYVAVLLFTLVLIGGALLLMLRSSSLPTDTIVDDLTATMLDIRVLDMTLSGMGMAEGSVTDIASLFLSEEAAVRDIRLMIATNEGTVLFDSTGALLRGDTIHMTTRAQLLPHMMGRSQALYEGHFETDDGADWVYVAQSLRPLRQSSPTTPYLIAAQPIPRPSLRQVLNTFGDVFLQPLWRAGLIGLLIALGLSALIARSVARPLQQMSQAARRIAQGDYRQRVPVHGPREVRQLAASFNEMAGRVALTQQAQQEFLANVSHDLRTPLTSIQGFSQAIAEGVASDPQSAQHAAQIIYDEAARLHRMVESLLDLARIEAGRLDMTRRAVQPGEVLRAVAESLSVRARDKSLQLNASIPPDLPRIAGDGDRLAQVFTNLIDNAIRHTPPGGSVSLNAGTQADGISIEVRDTGEGIPPDDLPRIFERFYRVDKSRQSSGVGLGLAITKQIVEAHGGTIGATSTPGQGAVFTVWLPLTSPEISPIKPRR